MKAYAIISRKSGNIVREEQISNTFLIFSTMESAEIFLKTAPTGGRGRIRRFNLTDKEKLEKWEIREIDIFN